MTLLRLRVTIPPTALPYHNKNTQGGTMNVYKCMNCQTTQALTCTCGSAQLWLIGDEHLTHLGLEVYIATHTTEDKTCLIIKKPSGQVSVPLQDQDLFTSFTPPQEDKQQKQGEHCPACGRWIGPGIHGQTTICICQAPLFYRRTGPEPRWISLQQPDEEEEP